MKLIVTLATSTLLCAGLSAHAGDIDGNAVLGGAVGGALGTAIGSKVGGRDGAIVGGAIGGATGAAIGSSASKKQETRVVREREVVYVDKHDNGRHLGQHKRKHHHGHDD